MAKALQYASGYSLDLYCDQPVPYSEKHRQTETFNGENWRDVAGQASKAGWKIHKDTRTATCPFCVRRLRKAST